jgi:hypothetical protein
MATSIGTRIGLLLPAGRGADADMGPYYVTALVTLARSQSRGSHR